MKETPEKITDKEKEIDLLEVSSNIASSLKNGIVKFFTFIFKAFVLVIQKCVLLFQLAINSWKFAVISALILGGVTIYLYKTNEPFYDSDAYGITRISNSQEIIQIINSISIPNDKLKVSLKNDLNLSPDIYNNIIDIKASWLIDLNGDGIADFVDYDNDYQINKAKDTLATRMIDRFNVRLKLKNQTITNDVQSAIITFLYNNTYIKSLNDSRIENIRGEAQIYENQADVLDSLQNYEYFEESKIKDNNVQSLKFGEFELIGSDPQKEKRLYHQNIIDLKNSVIKNNADISYKSDPIVFVGNFTNSSQPTNDITYYVKKVAIFGVPIFLLIFIILKRKEFEKIFKINAFLEK